MHGTREQGESKRAKEKQREPETARTRQRERGREGQGGMEANTRDSKDMHTGRQVDLDRGRYIKTMIRRQRLLNCI